MVNFKSKQKMILGATILILVVAILLLKIINLPISNAIDNIEPKIEASLDKYINYNISEQNKGTLVQYSIRSGIEYQQNQGYVPVRQSEINIGLNKIDDQFPYDVKVITKSTQATNGNKEIDDVQYGYVSNTGKLTITASNQNENNEPIYTEGSKDDRDEYIIMCYYNTYTTEQPEREIKFDLSVKYSVYSEDNTEISKNGEFKEIVKENRGELTSTNYKIDDIYNGYIKSNIINGTEYATEYKELEEITVSKKEEKQELKLLESNEFVEIIDNNGEEVRQELGNNGNLVYKSTKISKRDILSVLGQEGILQIIDGKGIILAEINKDTNYAEDGTYTITYETEPEAIAIKTSEVKNEGLLRLEHTKEIKPTMQRLNNIYIKNNENITQIKDAQTSVNLTLNSEEWTNKEQNEITFDIKLNSNGIQYNLFKNPTVTIELPQEVEKVVLGENSLIYGNGLELQNVSTATNENGNIVIYANLVGSQTKYNINELGLETRLSINASVILKKELETNISKVNAIFTNDYTETNNTQTLNAEKEIKIINFKEDPEQKEIEERSTVFAKSETIETTSPLLTSQLSKDIKLEVVPTKGDKILSNNDVVYEGEYIKYNIKVTNTSNENIENAKVVATIPEGVTYGELYVEEFTNLGEYRYNFDDQLREKTIEIGTIEAGHSMVAYYEVKVNDINENEKQITTNISAYVGNEKGEEYQIENKIQKAETKSFMGAFYYVGQLEYYLNLYSNENKTVTTTINIPKGLKLENVSKKDESIENIKDSIGKTEFVYLRDKEENIEKIPLEISNENTIITELNTNSSYIFTFIIDENQIEKEPGKSEKELIAFATIDNKYNSNENRMKIKYNNIKTIMTSDKEGENLEYGEEVEYKITIENIGVKNTGIESDGEKYVVVNLADILPDEVKGNTITYNNYEFTYDTDESGMQYLSGFKEVSNITQSISGIRYNKENGNKVSNVDLDLIIPEGESVNITLAANAGWVDEDTVVENNATASGDNIPTVITNTIQNTILKHPNAKVATQTPSQTPTNPNSQGNNQNQNQSQNQNQTQNQTENSTQTPNQGSETSKNYSISGLAWLDENKDGQRQSNEKNLSGITVALVDLNDTTDVKDTTTTSNSGNYSFNNLSQGNYLVLFRYDKDKYRLTSYQKSNVNNAVNSDAMEQAVTLNGSQEVVGVTDEIQLNQSASNIDLGLIENKYCDFKIEKYISKIKVSTSSGTKEYNYNNESMAKAEIKAKEIDGATVAIEYNIVVTNDGEVTGKVGQLIDELPSELNFSADMNKGWGQQTGDKLVYTGLSNKNIKAGESIEIPLIATKRMTANSTGIFTNTAKIQNIESIEKASDGNSENNSSKADVILSVSTGIVTYITIVIISLIALCIALFILNKYGKINLKKIFKLDKILALIIFTFVISMASHQLLLNVSFAESDSKKGDVDWSTSENRKKYNIEEIKSSQYQELAIHKYPSDFQNTSVQGFCVTDKHYVFAMLKDYGATSYVYFLDINNPGNILKILELGNVGHMNDMTYNPNTGIITATGDESKTWIDINDTTMEVEKKVSAKSKVGAIAYDSSRNKYLQKVTGTTRLNITDANFNIEQTKEIFPPALSNVPRLIPQGMGTDNKYIYFTQWECGFEASWLANDIWNSKQKNSNLISVYDYSGNSIKNILIPNTIVPAEIESVDFNSNNEMIVLLQHQTAKDIRIAKIKMDNTSGTTTNQQNSGGASTNQQNISQNSAGNTTNANNSSSTSRKTSSDDKPYFYLDLYGEKVKIQGDENTAKIQLGKNPEKADYTFAGKALYDLFYGGPTGRGYCQDYGLLPAGWDSETDTSTTETYRLYDTDITTNTQESSESVSDFTLTKIDSEIQSSCIDEYCKFGPFKFEYENEIDKTPNYTVLVTLGDGREIEVETDPQLTGDGKKEFYIKLKKEDCQYGITRVVLRAKADVKKVIITDVLAKSTYKHSSVYQKVRTGSNSIWAKVTSEWNPEIEKEIEWTGPFPGIIEVEKRDADNNSIKLEGVEISVNGETKTTDKAGKVVFENLPIGTKSIIEINNPNYGYPILVEDGSVDLISGQYVFYEMDNEKRTGTLVIEKKDIDTGKPLDGVKFKIMKGSGYVTINGQNEIIGSTSVEDKKWDEVFTVGGDGTTFVTDSNGQIKIENILVSDWEGDFKAELKGAYGIRETDVGNQYGYTEFGISTNVDGDYVYIDGGAIGGGIGNAERQGITSLEKSQEAIISIGNRRKYVKISGNVWEDILNEGKVYSNDNIFAENDIKIEDLKVTLKAGDSEVQNSNSQVFKNPTYTDSEGYYYFEDVLIDELANYYIEFEYDGEIYTTVEPFTGDSIEQSSKAKEVGSKREELDNKYKNITGTGERNASTVNGQNGSFNVPYDVTDGVEATATAQYRTEFNRNLNGNVRTVNKFESPYISDNIIIATTEETGYGALGENTPENIRQNDIKELTDRNCGLVLREQVDLSVSSDIDNVEVRVNGYKNNYMYRRSGNTNSSEADDKFRLEVKANKYGYERKLYRSDIVLLSENDRLCEVYIVYKMTVANNSSTLSAKVTDLLGYYDSRNYEVYGTYVPDDINNPDTRNIANFDEQTRANYRGSEVSGTEYSATHFTELKDTVIPAMSSRSFYVKYKVNPQTVIGVLNAEQYLNKSSVIEINTYTTYYDDSATRTYASIDADSAPGNSKAGSTDTYEDDTSYAPSVTIKLTEAERTISGTIFEDEQTPQSANNNERLGDGQYAEANDGTVQGVKVDLLKYDEGNITLGNDGIPSQTNLEPAVLYKYEANTAGSYEKIKEYTREKQNSDSDKIGDIQVKYNQVVTDSQGKYEFSGIIPDEYILRFTYANGNVVYKNGATVNDNIDVNQYKATIIKSPKIREALNNNNIVGDGSTKGKVITDSDFMSNKWYDIEPEIRYSDAMDSNKTVKEELETYTVNNEIYENNSVFVTTKEAYTGTMNIQVEFDANEKNTNTKNTTTNTTMEINGVDSNGDNAYYTIERLKALTNNVDFGIVQKAKHAYELKKEVSNINVVLANGQTEITGDPHSQNLNYTQVLDDNMLGFRRERIKLELENEIQNSATLQITYSTTATNKSEINYLTPNYYRYGEQGGNKETIIVSKVIDYFGNGLDYIVEDNQQVIYNGKLENNTIELNGKSDVFKDKSLKAEDYINSEAIETARKYNQVLVLNSNKELEPGETENWTYKGTVVLSAKNDELEFTNDVEGIEYITGRTRLENTSGQFVIPGDYDPSSEEPKDIDTYTSNVIITSPTGENRSYTIYIIGGIVLVVLIGGIIIIKRKVL